MTQFSPNDSSMLHAYLDGALDPTERQTFEALLTHDPALATALETEQYFRASLRQRAIQVQAPASLRADVQAALAAPVSAPSWGRRFLAWWTTPRPIHPAAVLLYILIPLVLLGGVVWWLALSSPPETPTYVELADIHALYFEQTPALDVPASPPEIKAWFQNRVPFTVNNPVLTGWSLAGARLGELHRRGTAHLLYQRPTGQHLSLTLFTPRPADFPGSAQVRFAGQDYFVGDNGQHRTVLWQTGNVGYAVIADVELPAEELLSLAADIRQQLP